MKTIDTWQHVFKLDPAKSLTDDELDQVCESGTDAIIVGGTDNVTLDGVLDLLSHIRRYEVTVALEVSNTEAVTPGFDYYLIPMVLNSTEKKWMMDLQHEAIKSFGPMIPFDDVRAEGYCIMNPDAKAFQLAHCQLPTVEDAVGYAKMAEHLFHLPIFYLEYSGVKGDIDVLKKVAQPLKETQLIYGGGIKTLEDAKEMKQYADTIVVGNSLYTDFNQAIKTVKIK
ncbi:heptaprenylglyceryl phosphate synthase [Halolactibacillus alkaliphilus]|uniref:Heptaprenylglyceryl phosphate synthase n=1 Tax=Halolactibacillus alkaliphilus TaxID=442899 RepID=A0A511X2L7_9BACI|nr:heptaprenylglyceryl phosphate synthase [Halolactibacillus alkaliphilus]GEN57189.1 heptaprenylglyceryl phosphate synthase [Halolactibacillus alkaliphilus]GGN72681.1 heptaprenylglyceryl phosphate synthase [Halolactibacillus alkaliphilus]